VKGPRTFDLAIPRQTLAPLRPLPATYRGKAVRRVDLPKGVKLVALTFDLCESGGEIAGYDGPIFDYLRANNIKATFFSGGKWMVSHPERTRQIISDPLIEAASHGWAHRNVRMLPTHDLDREILGPQHAYEAARGALAKTQCAAGTPSALHAIPPRIGLFRFPFGACNATALERVHDAGLIAVQWDVSTGDPDPHQSAQAIANAILSRTRPGSIVLMHANGRGHNTAAALPLALPKLKAQGYTFVTVSELLAAGTPVLVPTCYDSKPGDTDKYDRLFPVAGARTEPPNEFTTTIQR
jgi:peptidoglycan/xylan/chitin deacetylase (PgdA/CDA1 family)